ncbi:sporulation transcription factor Spo0A [Clostridium algoriphilum]|uniref:sporulation transcription factor Spo0A n=1 Tax=Clostridium algoriphilum TaxID=198347 RepID=UPI001CF56B5B|nr:sporulation transcription factor Spo0A [Clostridium algoriphilum]MCB2294548.1 sporulation transcription factor Spo0A [Clostridium algoriphilum]
MEEPKINIVIADNDKDFCNVLYDYLLTQEDIVVNGIAEDGAKALTLIKDKKPDLVILDLVMPILDGLKVLESLNTMELDQVPRIIVLSAVDSDIISQKAVSLGADYYVTKPFDIEIFIKRIRRMFNTTVCDDDVTNPLNNLKKTKIEIKKSQRVDLIGQITSSIHEIGIPANIKSYMYLREAINMVVNNASLLSSVPKELYPLIGEKFNTTASMVDSSISHAIDVARTSGKAITINKIFNYTIGNEKVDSTNSDYIEMVTNKSKL